MCQQESWTIAKMTARCALYASALKTFSGVPGNAHGYFSRNFNGHFFWLMLWICSYTKFEVHSFTRSWDNWGTPKNLCSSWIRPRSLYSKICNGLSFDGSCECSGQILSPYSFTHSWDNSDLSFGWGCEPPVLGKSGRRGSGIRTVRKSVSEFL